MQWLTGEAGAGWIVGVVGIIVGALYYWKSRPQPPKIAIQEIRRTRLLDIHSSQQEKLKVTLIDSEGVEQDVKNLEQREFVIYNNGKSDLLEPVELSLKLAGEIVEEKKRGVWYFVNNAMGRDNITVQATKSERDYFQQWSFDNPECEISPFSVNEKQLITGIRFKIPYLNSYPAHQHYLVVRLIADGEYIYELNSRVGKGWSSYFVALRKMDMMKRRWRFALRGTIVLVMGLIYMFFALTIAQRMFGEQSLLWSSNLTPEKINQLVKECEQSCSQNYREDLENLANLNFINKFFYRFRPVRSLSFSDTLFLGIAFIFLVIAIFESKISSWLMYKFLRVRPTSEFSIEE